MLLIYSRHIQKQHGFGLTKFYFLGQTWWYLNLMIWFEEIKSRVNMSYDFGTARQWRSIKWLSNKMSVKIAKHCFVCSWYVNVEMFANWYEASVCLNCLPGKSISNQIKNQKYKVKKVKTCQSSVIFFLLRVDGIEE